MKKILLSLVVAAIALTSCDMDLAPAGTLDSETGISSVSDVKAFRTGLYSNFRALTSSGFFTYPEIQMDMFLGTVINGNRGGQFSNGNFTSADGTITGYWAGLFTYINNCNYILEKAQPLLDKAKEAGNDAQVAELERYIGEAHFFRGYYYAEMMDRFCQVYNPAKGDDEGLGCPIVTVYYPTADRSKYPGRSSMNATISFINDEFKAAYDALAVFEQTDKSQLAPMAAYVSTQAVLAMQARVALWIGDYPTAVTKANDVITAGYYTLANPDDYIDMWDNDYGTEIILMPFMSAPNELSNSIGGRWLSVYEDQADYVPTFACLGNYYDSDCRFDAFFGVRALSVTGATVKCYAFYKFPGNPALVVSGTNLMNKAKTIRLSEMYLILAEAAYMANQPTVALDAYNDFCSYRYEGWEDESLSGQALLDEIRDERARELIGEGFRMSDLRRWGKGFKRSGEYPINPAMEQVFVKAGTTVVYQPNDYRYTWPIPADELSVNPQIKNQQNPGY